MMRNHAPILIVDDDVDIRELMKLILETDGYDVALAADGLDALEQIRAGLQPTLILLDLMMPQMDGEEFLKQLRASCSAPIPVIIMSGHCTANRTAEELHVAYLTKPVEFDDLLKTVRGFVPRHYRRDAA